MAKKKGTTIPIVPEPEKQIPKITGNRQEDLQAYRKSMSVDFGIQLLKHYTPYNQRLIAYCQVVKDEKYITENLNIILNGNNS